ncbi:MAG: MFS transporter [Deltaproteobacteria bacterium]|nr:MFS transporter [Deltaproteobacteria bacterium]
MGLLFFALFNSILGLSVLFPVMGPLGRSLHLSETEIGLVSTGYALTQLLFAPLWGRLSETRGRKPVLLVGIVGYAIGFALFGASIVLAQQMELPHGLLVGSMVGARMLGGALSSATLPTAQALAADLSDQKSRTAAMGLIGAAFGLAVIFGPGIGAGIAHFFGLLAPVWLSVGLALANAVLVALRLHEPARKTRSTHVPALWPVAKKVPALLAVSFVATLSSVAMEQTIAFAFQDRLGLTADQTPARVGMGLVAYGIVAVFAQGFLVRRYQIAPRTLVLVGLPIALIGMALLVFVTSFPMLVVALTVQGLGQGLVLPGVTSALSLGASDTEQGAIAGLHASAQGLARLLGPLVGAHLYQLSGALPYELAAGLLLAALIFVALSKDVARTHAHAPSAQGAAP